MKLVTLARPMPPGHGIGDQRLVTDDVAKALEADGFVSASQAWPPGSEIPAPAKPRRADRGGAR